MKIKGIPFWEQHIEKFVLAGFGIVLVGVAVSQFILRPNDVTMENTQVGPDGIEQRLRTKADSIRHRLSSVDPGPELVPKGEVILVGEPFKAALDGDVAPRTTLPVTGPSLAAAILPTESVAGNAIYYVPKLPAPTMIAVRREFDTLDETAVKQYPELLEVLKAQNGEGNPSHDIGWVIPVATVDAKGIAVELHKAQPPVLPIPTIWYHDSLWFVDVVFEREEKRADGTWSDNTVIPVLPSQFSFRKEIPTADAPLRDAMFRLLAQKDKVLEILQPEFLPTKGNTFSPALVLEDNKLGGAAAGEDEAVRRLKRDYARKVLDRDHTNELMVALGGPCEPKKPDDAKKAKDKDKDDEKGGGGKDNGGSNAPGGGGLGGGGGFDGGKNKGDSKKAKEDEEKCIRITKRWKDLNDQVAKLEEQLKKLAPDAALAGSKSKMIDLAKDETVKVWAHDITAKAGSTYRYRCHIDTYNPYFTHKGQLVKEQQPLADAFLLATATSPWGPEVTIEPPVSFFVTAAEAGEGRLELGSAKIEVYRFHDGARRSDTITVQPGDRIGGPTEGRRDPGGVVDFSTDWYVVDIIDDTSTSDRGDRQQSAKVVIRRMSDPTLVIRTPRDDAADDDRIRFSDETQALRDAAQSAKDKEKSKDKDESKDGTGNPRSPGGSGPGGGFGNGSGGGGRPPK